MGKNKNPVMMPVKTRSKTITFKAGLALLICFLIGIAAAALLLYTLL